MGSDQEPQLAVVSMCAPPDAKPVPYPRDLFLELPDVSEAQVRGTEMCSDCVKAMSAALGGALAAVVGHIASMMPAIAAGVREVQEAIAALTGESNRGERDD
ncbi:MAG: hypothetical protein Q4C85_08560 [Actinomyces sp.]|uniref:hypothetical protein n=1 Tax=Actinomyces sp. TaxID=29317 RepID=UPI0026DD1B5D|nr:hypothetical protein [Actinomyces sp.]MDO4243789.1 hypothetical protein [Actinomyces sp.]